MTAVVRAQGLGKRYGHRWALSECTVDIPAGRVVGLVGPNGAGKTTLLRLAVGQLAPTTGSIEVLGGQAGSGRGAVEPGRLRRAVHARLLRTDRRRAPEAGRPTQPALGHERSRGIASTAPASIPGSAPGGSPAGTEHSSPSPWRSPSARTC